MQHLFSFRAALLLCAGLAAVCGAQSASATVTYTNQYVLGMPAGYSVIHLDPYAQASSVGNVVGYATNSGGASIHAILWTPSFTSGIDLNGELTN